MLRQSTMEVLLKRLLKNPHLGTINELEILIDHANTSYHNAQSVMPDYVYDSLLDRLRQLDPNNALVGSKVGAEPTINKTRLPFFMGSMDKKSDAQSISRFVERKDGPFVVSDKLDGVSALYVVNKGMAKMYTRGDGSVGQDITSTLMPHLDLPAMTTKKSQTFAIRGELIVSRKDFMAVVKDKAVANPRNFVSGLVNAKRPDTKFVKHLRFVAYAVYEPELDMADQLSYMHKHGFETVWHTSVNAISYANLIELLNSRRKASDFEIDGLIISTLEFTATDRGNPTNAFAFKTALGQDFAIVTLSDIEWHISKDGVFKPTLVFEPVNLNGVEIRRCTGFNARYIVNGRLGVGAKIRLIRAGLVIPHCESVISPSTSGKPLMPGDDYAWNASNVDIVMTESEGKGSNDLKLRVLQHFVEKLSISGMGKGVTKRLFDGSIDDPYKVLHVTHDQLLNIQGFKDTSAHKLLISISEATRIASGSCVTYMIASNSFGKGFGDRKLSLFIEAIPEVTNPKSSFMPTMSQMTNIGGISNISAEAFMDGLKAWRVYMRKYKLDCTDRSTGQSTPTAPSTPQGTQTVGKDLHRFRGKNFVFTKIRDRVLEKELIEVGAIIQENVTKKTDFLVTKDSGDQTGKVVKAREYGVTVITIDHLLL